MGPMPGAGRRCEGEVFWRVCVVGFRVVRCGFVWVCALGGVVCRWGTFLALALRLRAVCVCVWGGAGSLGL